MKFRSNGLVALGMLALVTAACNMKPAEGKGRHIRKVSQANVAEFDPSELNFDIMSVGSERPNEDMIQQAFESAYGSMDACVATAKERTGNDARIEGELELAVRLNPRENKPLGVNASGPDELMKRKKLVNCFREAVAKAQFPTYDGPPVETSIALEVDPG